MNRLAGPSNIDDTQRSLADPDRLGSPGASASTEERFFAEERFFDDGFLDPGFLAEGLDRGQVRTASRLSSFGSFASLLHGAPEDRFLDDEHFFDDEFMDDPFSDDGFLDDRFEDEEAMDADGDVDDVDVFDEPPSSSTDDRGRRPMVRLAVFAVVVVLAGASLTMLTGRSETTETAPGPDSQALVDDEPVEQEIPVLRVEVEEDEPEDLVVAPDDETTDQTTTSTSASTSTSTPASTVAPAPDAADDPAVEPDPAPAATAASAPADGGQQPSPDTSGDQRPATDTTGAAAAPQSGAPPAAATGTPAVFRYYGNPQIALSLADTEAGGRSIDAVGLRIRFPRSGTLTGVRTFLVYRPGQAGADNFYHKGDGGTIEFRLEADDGSSGHHASGRVLARTGNLIGGPELYRGSGPSDAKVGGESGDDSNFRKFSFQQPVQVEAGTWYHLVMYNTGNDPRNNFVSYDNLNAGDRGRRAAVPLFGDLDYGVAYRSGGGWVDRDQHWGIGDFYFSDGSTYGNGYMEVGSVNGPDRASTLVSPDQAVRQRFVPQENLVVTGAHVGAMHVSGSNSLDLRLVDRSGTELWRGRASGFPSGRPSGGAMGQATVVTAEFRGDDSVPSVVLQSGQEYFLEVLSTGGTHSVSGLRDGSVRYRFSEGSTVAGHAELRKGGGSWSGWPLGHASSARTEYDLSFYLVTANCVGCR